MAEVPPPRIVVVGSLNMDLVLEVPAFPRPGETVAAKTFQSIPGGKGANQAVALARLGARVAMLGRVGDDSYGVQLRDGLAAEGVDVESVLVTPATSTGIALIEVAPSGENAIVIVAGANGQLTPSDIESHARVIQHASMLVVQNETPMETVVSAALIAKRLGVPVVYDPAPAPSAGLPAPLWSVDILTPNQSEAEMLAGSTLESTSDAVAAARFFRSQGAKQVVLKLGARGALILDSDDRVTVVPAFQVTTVDTTAAGDAFTAALALQWSLGRTLVDAVRWACAAGALAVGRRGAQPAMPTVSEVEQWLATSPESNR